MHVTAAEVLGRDDLTGRGLHQRRAAEEDRALVAHDHRLVGHRRDVGAAGGAGAHHAGDLRDAPRGHGGLVEEDPAEVLAVGEDLVLQRQERAAGVDEVDARQVVLRGDRLRAQVLLDRHRVVGAALDRRVVGDDDALATRHPPDAGDHAGGRDGVVVAVRRTSRRRRAGPARGTGCPGRAAGRPGRGPAACRGRCACDARSPTRPGGPGPAGHAGRRRAHAWSGRSRSGSGARTPPQVSDR